VLLLVLVLLLEWQVFRQHPLAKTLGEAAAVSPSGVLEQKRSGKPYSIRQDKVNETLRR
jgi:hypothetical protein